MFMSLTRSAWEILGVNFWTDPARTSPFIGGYDVNNRVNGVGLRTILNVVNLKSLIIYLTFKNRKILKIILNYPNLLEVKIVEIMSFFSLVGG